MFKGISTKIPRYPLVWYSATHLFLRMSYPDFNNLSFLLFFFFLTQDFFFNCKLFYLLTCLEKTLLTHVYWLHAYISRGMCKFKRTSISSLKMSFSPQNFSFIKVNPENNFYVQKILFWTNVRTFLPKKRTSWTFGVEELNYDRIFIYLYGV